MSIYSDERVAYNRVPRDVRSRRRGGAYLASTDKRLVDMTVAAILLVALAPVMVVIAVAIKTTSRGPVLFRQTRNGLNQQPFELYKFRSMIAKAAEDSRVSQASRDDPRITRVGRFLRRTSLDELPQLVNVLRGDMSLIGPRPHALVHDDYYGRVLPDYALRFAARPGISGLAQVNGARGETRLVSDMERRLDYDLAYLRDASLSTDFRIALRTVREVTSSRHAF